LSTRSNPYAAFRSADYRRYAVGNTLSLFGQQMLAVAIHWELYERTHDAAVLGGVGLALFIPFLLLVLPSGYWADRYERRGLVLLATALELVVCVGLALSSLYRADIWPIYGLLALGGVAHALKRPAANALVPQLVPAEDFPNAAVWQTSMMQLSTVLGPGLGGILIGLLHRATDVYWIAAVCSALCWLLLLGVKKQQPTGPHREISVAALRSGWDFIRSNPLVLSAITLDMFAVLLGGAVTLLPIYAKDILQVGPEGLGWLRAAQPLGALLMAMILAHLPPIRHAGKALLWVVVGFGLATIGFGLSKNIWLSMAMLALTGAFDNVSMVIRIALVQLSTPDEMRGRVSAVNSIFIGTSNELGGAESGFVAKWMGPEFSAVSGGIGTLLTVAWVAIRWPELRRLGALESLSSNQTEPAIIAPEVGELSAETIRPER
jgi:MFS family permease